MMGLSEIKKANRNPLKYARSKLSSGQERRETSSGRYWSEKPNQEEKQMSYNIDNLSSAADHGRLNEEWDAETGQPGPSNPIPGSDWIDPKWPYSAESYQRDVASMVDATQAAETSPLTRLRTMTPSGKALVDEFAAVRLIATLDQLEGQTAENRARLSIALSQFRRADRLNRPAMMVQLQTVYNDINSPELEIVSQIEDAIKTVDHVRKNFEPLHIFLAKLRNYYNSTTG